MHTLSDYEAARLGELWVDEKLLLYSENHVDICTHDHSIFNLQC